MGLLHKKIRHLCQLLGAGAGGADSSRKARVDGSGGYEQSSPWEQSGRIGGGRVFREAPDAGLQYENIEAFWLIFG